MLEGYRWLRILSLQVPNHVPPLPRLAFSYSIFPKKTKLKYVRESTLQINIFTSKSAVLCFVLEDGRKKK
jgi:hypothetical protein